MVTSAQKTLVQNSFVAVATIADDAAILFSIRGRVTRPADVARLALLSWLEEV